MVPSTGQSSLPRLAVVMEPGPATAPRRPRAASSRRARSSAASRPLSRASSFWSAVSRRSVLRAERCSDASRRARACGQVGELGDLRLALLARAVELGPHVEDVVPLDDHAVPELLDVRHQGPVLPAGEVEVLVAAEQVAERLGGEQRLEGVERPALVDVDQPALEHGAPLGQVVLGQDQLGARAVELARRARRSGARSRSRSAGSTRAGARGC